MAVNKRNRVYRLTPRRKAALHKAQLASARKRSRRGRVALGVVGATIVAGGLTYAGHRHLKGRSGKTNVVHVTAPTMPEQRQLGTRAGKGIDVRRVTPTKTGSNWKIVGRAFNFQAPPKTVRRRKRLNYVESEKARLRKENTRQKRNSKARRGYWKSKPVGGGYAKIRDKRKK